MIRRRRQLYKKSLACPPPHRLLCPRSIHTTTKKAWSGGAERLKPSAIPSSVATGRSKPSTSDATNNFGSDPNRHDHFRAEQDLIRWSDLGQAHIQILYLRKDKKALWNLNIQYYTHVRNGAPRSNDSRLRIINEGLSIGDRETTNRPRLNISDPLTLSSSCKAATDQWLKTREQMCKSAQRDQTHISNTNTQKR